MFSSRRCRPLQRLAKTTLTENAIACLYRNVCDATVPTMRLELTLHHAAIKLPGELCVDCAENAVLWLVLASSAVQSKRAQL